MILALYKAALLWKESSGLGGLDLVKILVRDQLMYFAAYVLSPFNDYTSLDLSETRVIYVSVMQIIGDTSLNTIAANILVAIGHPGFLSILGSRLLIHMKEAGEKGVNEGTSYRFVSEMDMDFAVPPAPEMKESSLTFTDQESQREAVYFAE